MPTYVSDAEVLKAIVRRLGAKASTVAENGPAWDEIAKESNQDAYEHLRETLVIAGFPIGTIDTWDHRARWNRLVAVCFALRAGSTFKAYEMEAVESQCQVLKDLEELAEKGILVGGALVEPVDATAGVGVGMGPSGIEDLDLDPDTDLA